MAASLIVKAQRKRPKALIAGSCSQLATNVLGQKGGGNVLTLYNSPEYAHARMTSVGA
jgi:hypothetical protein